MSQLIFKNFTATFQNIDNFRLRVGRGAGEEAMATWSVRSERSRTWEIVEVGVRHHTYNLNVKEDIGGEKIAGLYAPSVP
jgi:hypothetical protein